MAVLRRVKEEIRLGSVPLVSAGVSFYSFLALIPALSATISLWGLMLDPEELQAQLATLRGFLPPSAYELVSEQLTRISSQSKGALSGGLVVSVLFAIWSAKKGMQALIRAINVAYDEEDYRGFVRSNLLAIGLTAGAVAVTLIVVGLAVAAPMLLDAMGLGEPFKLFLQILRWPIVALLLLLSLAVLYRVAPARDQPKWRWVTPGSVFAVIGSMASSALFSFYVSTFGNYNETYGALGAVAVLLMWFWIGAFVIMVGAEINSELEAQTATDTTTDEPPFHL